MIRISDKPLAFQALQQRRRERSEVLRIAAERKRLREQRYTNVFNPMLLKQQPMSCRCNEFL